MGYPHGFAAKFPDFVFDAVPYSDMLLGDLQLKSHRKKGIMAEWFELYGPEDYRDLVAEWRIQRAQRGNSEFRIESESHSDLSRTAKSRGVFSLFIRGHGEVGNLE